MKLLSTTQEFDNGVLVKTTVHTSTSCHLIDRVICVINGENSAEIAKLVIKAIEAINGAINFVSGFDGDDQNDVKELLSKLNEFSLTQPD